MNGGVIVCTISNEIISVIKINVDVENLNVR